MNIVFTGITGVRKASVMRALAVRRAAEYRALGLETQDPDDPEFRKFICWADVDRFFTDAETQRRIPVAAVLADGEIQQIRREWPRAFGDACAELSGARYDRYLAVHATYFFHSRPSIPVDIRAIASFEPHLFVTLLDDCYSIWWRVSQQEREHRRGSYLRLQDVLKWRQFDLWVVQQVVNDLSALQGGAHIPHFVISVKHPLETLYRMVYEVERLTVYGSRPITDVRSYPRSLHQVEREYNSVLRDRFVLSEPDRIDEKALQFAFERQLARREPTARELRSAVKLYREDRLPVREPIVADEPDMFEPHGLPLPLQEVYQIAILADKDGKSEIDHQILERDFWFIRMTDRTVAYRPYWNAKCPLGAQGVIAELKLARRLRKSPVYVTLASDRAARGRTPLEDEISGVKSVEELVEVLENAQQEFRRQSREGGP